MTESANAAQNATQHITRLVLRGYKSIAECDLELRQRNLLIGANGAGKSNFLGFFRLVQRILDGQLQSSVDLAGGPDALLHFGRKNTQQLHAQLYFGDQAYRFALQATQGNRMKFAEENLTYDHDYPAPPGATAGDKPEGLVFDSGRVESTVAGLNKQNPGLYAFVEPALRWRVYHFNDASESARIKQINNINDNEYLRDDARNLAAFLFRLKNHHARHYHRIVKTIQLVVPFFGDFLLRPTLENKDRIQLEWTESGQDEPFLASTLSDGTLRFICLTTLLLQPEEFMPTTILIDEPELGLHPFAIGVLGGLMRSVAHSRQLIVSTQSVELVNEFDPGDLIVVDKRGGASTFTRPDSAELATWLDEYSLGELWKKNLLGGGPGR